MLISPHEFAETFAALTATVTAAWAAVYIIRAAGRRIAGSRLSSPPPSQSLPPDFAARWERLEQSMDAMAIEVERISEAQRFTTKLLADRPANGTSRLPSSDPRRHNSPTGGGVPVE
ncbi:MAG TPA: hypothetical protein VKA84_01760 [Gemmatimonadaceae bacterium]|nr:hypothetical protein [Gemmatimonadaceae bacterium]